MTFRKWIIKTFRHENNQFGDLARDISSDFYFPKRATRMKTIRKYLTSKRACDQVFEVFEQAYQKYQKAEVRQNEN